MNLLSRIALGLQLALVSSAIGLAIARIGTTSPPGRGMVAVVVLSVVVAVLSALRLRIIHLPK